MVTRADVPALSIALLLRLLHKLLLVDPLFTQIVSPVSSFASASGSDPLPLPSEQHGKLTDGKSTDGKRSPNSGYFSFRRKSDSDLPPMASSTSSSSSSSSSNLPSFALRLGILTTVNPKLSQLHPKLSHNLTQNCHNLTQNCHNLTRIFTPAAQTAPGVVVSLIDIPRVLLAVLSYTCGVLRADSPGLSVAARQALVQHAGKSLMIYICNFPCLKSFTIDLHI